VSPTSNADGDFARYEGDSLLAGNAAITWCDAYPA
jgi:hypothetical protein